MRLKTVLLLMFFVVSYAVIGQKVTVHGYMKDAETGESLISATVLVKGTTKGTVTNVYGFYSLSLTPGEYTLVYSYIGYENVEKKINLTEDIEIKVELGSDSETIQEVVIQGEASNANIVGAKMGVEKIDSKTIEKLPVLFGEADVIKTLQLMPGVIPTSTLSSSYSVRGGARDQNLILLDDAPVYNASHLFGIFSVFNNDAIKNVELYKGIIPAEYGGSISSVLDVRMNEGNNRKITGKGSVGLLSSKLTLESPLVYDKGSILVSARRTYLDLLTKLTSLASEDGFDLPYYFYDLNVKANYAFNDKHRIFLSGYFGRDDFDFSFGDETVMSMGMNWGNATGTLRWNYMINSKLFMNTTFVISNYSYEMISGMEISDQSFSMDWKAGMKDYTAKVDLGYYLNPNNTVRFGLSTTYHDFNIGEVYTIMDTTRTDFSVPKLYCYEHTAFLKNEQKLGEKVTLDYGLNFSLFQNVGEATKFELEDYEVVNEIEIPKGEVYNSYYNIDPRASISVQINSLQSVKLGYARTHQYMHIASISTSGTPLDVWMPVTNNIDPQYAHQGSLGYFRNFLDNSINLSLEGYYKYMFNQIEFVEFAQPMLNPNIEEDFRFGEGKAYGAEFMLKKKTGRFTGWLSYTWSQSKLKIKDIQEKDWYFSPHDQSHNLAVVGMYEIFPRLQISANWVYNSGKPITAPNQRFNYGQVYLPYYNGKNGDRIPTYHRLDMALTYDIKPRPKWGGSWVLSVYNLYYRKNADLVYFTVNEENKAEAHKVTYLPVLPSVAFNFNF